MIRQLPIYLAATALLSSPLLAQDAPRPQPAPGVPGAEPRKDDDRGGGVPRDPNAELPLRPSRPDGARPPRPPLDRDDRGPDGPPPGGPGDGQRRPPRDPFGGRPDGERPPMRTDRQPEGYGRPPIPGDERPGPYERALKPTPYIGVVTSPAPPVLAAQLGLNEGFGLVVEDVLPDSPAQAAGLQKFDVLKLVNDQQLAEPGQLSGLLRGFGKDTEVSITYIRKGQEQKTTAKIAEKMLPEHRPGADFQRKLGTYGLPFPPREQGDDLRTRGPLDRGDAPSGPADLLREARPGGAPQLRLPQTDGVSTFQTNRARIAMRDNDGEIEIALKDGQRTLTAKNPAGEIIFTGPVDTPEQRAAMPAPIRAKLDTIESQQRSFPRGRAPGPPGSRDTVPFPPPPSPVPNEPEAQ